MDVKSLPPFLYIVYNIFVVHSVMSLFHCHCICFHLNVYPTGPLLHENLDVQYIPHRQIRDLSMNLCGKDVSCITDNGNIE